jgi:hypothetical protein
MRLPRSAKQTDPRHEFESFGEILSRLGRERRELEAGMGLGFDLQRSQQLDAVQHILEGLTSERSGT